MCGGLGCDGLAVVGVGGVPVPVVDACGAVCSWQVSRAVCLYAVKMGCASKGHCIIWLITWLTPPTAHQVG